MPWNRYVIGYHGTSRAVAHRVVRGLQPLAPSMHDYDWLGHGQYFWEDSFDRAEAWARQQAATRRAPAVLGAVIDLGHCLNLVDTEAIRLVERSHQQLLELLTRSGKPMPQNRGQDLGHRQLDCAVFETLHQNGVDQGDRPYDTVRAFFTEGQPIYPHAGLRKLDHIQICVRNPKMIVGYFLPLHP